MSEGITNHGMLANFSSLKTIFPSSMHETQVISKHSVTGVDHMTLGKDL